MNFSSFLSVKFAIGNVAVNQMFDCDVIECGEKHYVNITNVYTRAHFENYSVKFESNTTSPFVAHTVNRAINANWKLLSVEVRPHLEKVLGEIMQTIITPILNRMAIQDFFQHK